MLTYTGLSISTVALVTGASEATRGVRTESICVTVISVSGTLIIICKSISSPTQEIELYPPTQVCPFPFPV